MEKGMEHMFKKAESREKYPDKEDKICFAAAAIAIGKVKREAGKPVKKLDKETIEERLEIIKRASKITDYSDRPKNILYHNVFMGAVEQTREEYALPRLIAKGFDPHKGIKFYNCDSCPHPIKSACSTFNKTLKRLGAKFKDW